MRAVIAAGRTSNGIFAARIMWGTLDELVAKLRPVYPDFAASDVGLLNRAFGRSRTRRGGNGSPLRACNLTRCGRKILAGS